MQAFVPQTRKANAGRAVEKAVLGVDGPIGRGGKAMLPPFGKLWWGVV